MASLTKFVHKRHGTHAQKASDNRHIRARRHPSEQDGHLKRGNYHKSHRKLESLQHKSEVGATGLPMQ